MNRFVALVVAVTLFGAPSVFGAFAAAQSPEICAPTQRMGKYRFLRQLSLDLYGRPPTIEEYEALHSAGDIGEQKIDEMLASSEFFDQLARYHRGFLWTSLPRNESLFEQFLHMREFADNGDAVVWLNLRKNTEYRRAYVNCLDMEHTNFDASGRALPMVEGYTEGECSETPDGCTMDGWVEISPYWAPETTIRVCAFDAQEHTTGTNTDNDGVATDCSLRNYDPGCGCGPDLGYCAADDDGRGGGNTDELREALTEEPARIFEGVIKAGRPYMEAFATNETYFNGVLRHYYRYLQRDDFGELREISEAPYTADWELIERPEYHSGILTTMGYLLRHTSQRARVNRLYTAFLCDPFVAPSGLPPATDPCSQNPDLSERCGCATCHTTIEPATTFFGRWEEADFKYRPELETYRDQCATCEAGDCPNSCNDYITRDMETTPGSLDGELGKLKIIAWRTPQEAAGFDQGPSGLFEQPGMQDRLASCAVQNFAEFVFNRELSTSEKGDWLQEKASEFSADGYDFISMAKTLLMDERYRKVE